MISIYLSLFSDGIFERRAWQYSLACVGLVYVWTVFPPQRQYTFSLPWPIESKSGWRISEQQDQYGRRRKIQWCNVVQGSIDSASYRQSNDKYRLSMARINLHRSRPPGFPDEIHFGIVQRWWLPFLDGVGWVGWKRSNWKAKWLVINHWSKSTQRRTFRNEHMIEWPLGSVAIHRRLLLGYLTTVVSCANETSCSLWIIGFDHACD